MTKYDTDQIRGNYRLSDIVSKYVKLARDGREMKGCCPFHDERTPSFHVVDDKEFYHCFGCGAHGDVVDFVQNYHGVNFREACKIITGEEPAPESERQKRESVAVDYYANLKPAKPPVAVEWEAGKRTPEILNPKRADDEKRRNTRYTPTMVFPYRTATGELLGYVLRIEIPQDDGKVIKITPTVRFASLPSGATTWTHWHFDQPRPLYGLDRLAAKPDGQVFICEGEKAADACARLLGVCAITWPGGTNAVDKADWTPLTGRKVVIWPDADAPGWKAGNEIATVLSGIAAEVKIIDTRDHAVKGWDVADAEAEGMSKADALAWGKARISQWISPVEEPKPPAEPQLPPTPPIEAYNDTAPALKPNQQEKPKRKEPVEKPKPHLSVVPANGTAQNPARYAWVNKLICKEDGNPKPTSLHNAILVLENHSDCVGMLSYNVFADEILLMKRPPWERGKGKWTPRSVRDDDATACAAWLETVKEGGPLKIAPPQVFKCFMTAAKLNEIDPPRTWLEELKWDGIERIDSWLTYYCGAKDTPYTRAVGRKWLIGAVKRVMQPGSKVDTMLILEGKQGLGKSQLLKLIGTWGGVSYFTDQVDDISHKDALMQIQGVVIIEFAELDTLNRAETDNIKKFLTRTDDRYRPPYGMSLVDRPRRCVFAGSVNPGGNGYLKDPTGARRFWPVAVGNIDLDGIKAAVPQLWAEAVQAWRNGEVHWIDDPELMEITAQEQSARFEDDPWAQRIDDIIRTCSGVTIAEVMDELAIPTERRDQRTSKRIGGHLRHRGWECRKDYRPNGVGNPIRRFYKPDQPEQEKLI
jgi:predicted P-loop ATPase